MAETSTLEQRNRETRRGAGGVRVEPLWPHARVHAFQRYTSDTTLLTWCGIVADLQDGAETTTRLINCSDCARASLEAVRG
jgi:hypothetical protein